MDTQSAAPESKQYNNGPGSVRPKRKNIFYSKIGLLLILLLILASIVGAYFWLKSQNESDGGVINTGRYQSVKLNNGEVFFGKLSSVNEKYMKLADVYYLKKDTLETEQAGTPATASPSLPTLIKHGTELWAPEDELIISKDDIVYWENLKDSGKVIEAIKNYKQR